MGIITAKYDIGDKVNIKTPGLTGEVITVTYNGYMVLYRCVYWIQGSAFFYEAYDYELELMDGSE